MCQPLRFESPRTQLGNFLKLRENHFNNFSSYSHPKISGILKLYENCGIGFSSYSHS
jgi:hypothetical protein